MMIIGYSLGKIAALLGLTFIFWMILSVGPQAKTAWAGSDQATALYQQAKELFAEDRQTRSLQVIIPKLEEYTKIGPDNPEAWEILSFASWLSGDQLAPKEKKAKLEWFNKGEAAADKILAKNPQSPAGLFWKSTNMASIADVKGWMSSLWMYPTLASNMKLVDQPSAPPFLYGATDRFWCEVLARVPLFLANKFGHSVSEITAKMEQQIQREPRFFANYTYAARLYWKVDNKKRALELLEYVLKHDPTIFHEERAYNKLHQLEAHKLWLEFTGKEFSKK